jgi:hypothetical protein
VKIKETPLERQVGAEFLHSRLLIELKLVKEQPLKITGYKVISRISDMTRIDCCTYMQ